jgi:hypothetical protein
MKVTPEQLATIASAIEPLDTEYRREVYRKGEFPRADAVRDLNKRYRWDLMLLADRHHRLIAPLYDTGCNDTHIDTALKAVVPAL